MLHLSLHHGGSLCAQHLDSLEDIHRPFVTHPLQDNAQSDEDTCPPHTGTAATQNTHSTSGEYPPVAENTPSELQREGVEEGKWWKVIGQMPGGAPLLCTRM